MVCMPEMLELTSKNIWKYIWNVAKTWSNKCFCPVEIIPTPVGVQKNLCCMARFFCYPHKDIISAKAEIYFIEYRFPVTSGTTSNSGDVFLLEHSLQIFVLDHCLVSSGFKGNLYLHRHIRDNLKHSVFYHIL